MMCDASTIARSWCRFGIKYGASEIRLPAWLCARFELTERVKKAELAAFTNELWKIADAQQDAMRKAKLIQKDLAKRYMKEHSEPGLYAKKDGDDFEVRSPVLIHPSAKIGHG